MGTLKKRKYFSEVVKAIWAAIFIIIGNFQCRIVIKYLKDQQNYGLQTSVSHFFVKGYLEAVIKEKLHTVSYCTKIGLFYNILHIFQSQEFLIFVSSDQIRNH